MGKNITIQEGGIAKQMTVNKLRTNLVGSGTCLWVPEDAVQLTTKTITENGTYNASNDGYYGYSQVIVSIPDVGKVTGKDGDGDEAVVHTDPETGNLVTDKVPSSIEVITPPTNPYGIYQNGQAISTEGMVVKAYLETGGEYGVVPNGEITINPTTAVYDASTDEPAGGIATSSLETSIPQPIAFSANSEITFSRSAYRDGVRIQGAATYIDIKSPTGGSMIALSKTRDGMTQTYTHSGESRTLYPNGSFEINGKTVYYAGYSVSGQTEVEYSGVDYSGQTVDQNSQWTMVWGDIEETRAGSRQTITVSWPRPGDGKVLETTFEILVKFLSPPDIHRAAGNKGA